MNIKEHLENYIMNAKKINTHCHHMYKRFYDTIGLKEILSTSYVGWCGEKCNTFQEREQLFKNLKNRSYFIWLSRALKELYGQNEIISNDNFDIYDKLIKEAFEKDTKFERLRTICHYEHIVEDCYWNYGDNLGDSDLFTPTFRINIFLNGFDYDFIDQDNYSISKFFSKKPNNIDEYILEMKKIIKEKIDRGCVALKCAIAYERGLNFYKTTRDNANEILITAKEKWTKKNKDDFQSYIFYSLCEIAYELDIPFQIHTGLGQIDKTNAINLNEVIKSNPNTKFVIFHLSFPHYEDVVALAHNYKNVYPDTCWVPLLSYNSAIMALNQIIDTTNGDKICWGCDTWTFEESYGAILAMRYVLVEVLMKRIEDDFMTIKDAENFIDNIFYNNAKKLYKL